MSIAFVVKHYALNVKVVKIAIVILKKRSKRIIEIRAVNLV